MASVWGELKRRNVVRVALAYAVVSWLLLQLADVLIPILGLPEWAGKLVFLLLAIGLPLAMFFAWAYELTPEGLKREHEVDRSQSITSHTGRRIDFLIIAVLVVAVGMLLLDKFLLSDVPEDMTVVADKPSETVPSIAVLPFANMSADENSVYFSDGLADTILHMLAQVSELRVAARTSSFQFRDQSMDVSKIGEQLNVGSVLEGSVQKVGNKIRVTAQLIDVSTGFHLWSGNFDRDLDDVFAIQDEIASEVVSALKVSLLGDAADRMNLDQTDNIAAYTEYILAVNDLDHVTSESLRSAISHLLEATRLDPNYARAFSTLGRAYFSLLSWGAINESDAIAAARTAASRALDISPDSAEALAVLGMAELFDGNRDAGEQLLKRAIENGPNDTVALNYYARYLRSVARPIEAIEYYQKMLRLDPLSEAAHVALSETYRSVRQYSNAKETITRFKRIDPNSVYADSEIFFMERQQGNFAAAVATMNDSLARVPDDTDPESASQLAQVYLALEMPEEAQRLFDRATEIDALHPTSRSGPLWVNYLLQQNQNDSVRLASELLDDRIDNRFGSRVIALITLYEHGANTGHYDLLLESLDNLYPTLLDDPPHDLDKSLTGTLHAGMALIGNGDVDRGSNYLHFFLNQNEPYREVYGVGLGSVVASLVLGDIQGALDKLADFSQYPYRDFSNGLLVEHSSLFDPIRDEPAFIALLTEYRENAEKQRRILRVMNEDTSER